MIRRPPRSTPLYSSAASDVYKRQVFGEVGAALTPDEAGRTVRNGAEGDAMIADMRLAGVHAEIDPAVDHLQRPADPRAQRLGMRRSDPRHLVGRQQPERRFARPEGAERGVAL